MFHRKPEFTQLCIFFNMNNAFTSGKANDRNLQVPDNDTNNGINQYADEHGQITEDVIKAMKVIALIPGRIVSGCFLLSRRKLRGITTSNSYLQLMKLAVDYLEDEMIGKIKQFRIERNNSQVRIQDNYSQFQPIYD